MPLAKKNTMYRSNEYDIAQILLSCIPWIIWTRHKKTLQINYIRSCVTIYQKNCFLTGIHIWHLNQMVKNHGACMILYQIFLISCMSKIVRWTFWKLLLIMHINENIFDNWHNVEIVIKIWNLFRLLKVLDRWLNLLDAFRT